MPSKKKTPTKKPAAKPANPAKLAAQTKAVREGKAAPKRVGKARTGAKPATPAKGKAKATPAAKASPAAKPKAKAKAPAKGPELDAKGREIIPPEVPRFNVRGLVCEMIGEQKHTDQEIIAAVAKAIPEKTINLNIIGATRSEMNHGKRFPSMAVAREQHTPPLIPYEQVLKVDGVNMLRSQRPPKGGKSGPKRKKPSKENDPLSKIGIAPVTKRTPARRATAPA